MSLTKQRASTDSLKMIYTRIAPKSIVTTWDKSLEDCYEKLFFVLDVRVNSEDEPAAGTGLVVMPYREDTYESVKTNFAKYPKNSFPFESINAELRQDVDKWVPVVNSYIKEGLVVDDFPKKYKELTAYIKSFAEGFKKPVDVVMILSQLRIYFNLYLNYPQRLRVSILPNPVDYRRVIQVQKAASKKPTHALMYVTPGSIVKRDTIALFFNNELYKYIHLDSWEKDVKILLSQLSEEGLLNV